MPDDAPQLRLLFPPGSERLVSVDADPFTTGRRPGSHLLIAEKDISRIQAEIRRGMEAGAVGLSTGLDYIAQCHATTDELVAACQAICSRESVFSGATALRIRT